MLEETKRFKKRFARYQAFVSFAGFTVRAHLVRDLIRALIADREKHQAYGIHHKINDNARVDAFYQKCKIH